MNSSRIRRAGTRTISLLLILAAIIMVGGCAHLARSTAAPKQYLWQVRDQFVALAVQDGGEHISANDHPARLSRSQIQGVLASLDLHEKGDDSATPVLTEYQLTVLSEQLQAGLAQAGSGDDVIFAIIGNHDSLHALAKRPMVTTGRVFVAGGKLHLILGMVHEDVGEFEDRRLKPFVPGARSAPSLQPSWRITSRSGDTMLYAPGRHDWLQFPLDRLEPFKNPTPHMEPAKTAPVLPAAEQAPPSTQVVVPAARSMEERLIILEGLKNKNLITTEEYQAKRKQILDGL